MMSSPSAHLQPASRVPWLAPPGDPLARELSPPARPAAAWPRHILVASHGSPSAEPAIAAAQSLAFRTGSSVEIIAAYVPHIPLPVIAERRGSRRCERPQRIEAAEILRAVHGQRFRLVQRLPRWPVRFDVGDPVSVIVRCAEEMGADLVAMGIGRDDPGDRVCGERTPQYAVRYVGVPLLAAAERCTSPTRCVIALVDGRVHAPTIRAALGLLPPDASVWIAVPDRWSGESGCPGVAGSARDIVADACGSDGAARTERLALERVELTGEPLAGVLRLADDVGAHLIAVPIRGMPGPVRTFLPNLAEPLLLSARCSVLVAPD